jgi:hypothetical protein
MNPFKTHKEEITGNIRSVIESSKGLPKTRTLDESLNAVMMPKDNYFIDCYYFALKELKILYTHKVVRITSENIIRAYNKENPEKIPTEPRVWGAVMARLSKEEYIIGQGWTTYQNPLGHRKPSRMWIISNKNS